MSIAPVTARGAAAPAQAQPRSASGPRFSEVLRATRPPSHDAGARSAPLRVLEHVERAQRRLDDILAQARAGRTFTGAELLTLQAEANRYSQTVELASKLVEQGAQTVKQAVNTPV